jgi:hypothetical protein
MNPEYINQITLDCLLNKEQFNNHINNKISKIINKKDKKFYRKRIFDLTKSLLINKDKPTDLFPDVKCAFDNYVKTCINYFKAIDNNDIIQDEYKYLENVEEIMNEHLENEIDVSELNIDSKEKADKLMMRSINIKPTLNNFVQKIKIKSEEMIIPKQKEVNLKDPTLKIKGIKKKNITNKYDENNESKKEETNKNEENKKI